MPICVIVVDDEVVFSSYLVRSWLRAYSTWYSKSPVPPLYSAFLLYPFSPPPPHTKESRN